MPSKIYSIFEFFIFRLNHWQYFDLSILFINLHLRCLSWVLLLLLILSTRRNKLSSFRIISILKQHFGIIIRLVAMNRYCIELGISIIYWWSLLRLICRIQGTHLTLLYTTLVNVHSLTLAYLVALMHMLWEFYNWHGSFCVFSVCCVFDNW